MRVLKGHSKHVCSLAFAPDGGALAAASVGGRVCLWDPAEDEPRVLSSAWARPPLPPSTDAASLFVSFVSLLTGVGSRLALAFSADGSTLAAGGDWLVRLWHVSSGEERTTLRAPAHISAALAFSEDGGTLTSAGPAGLEGTSCFADLRRWDLATGRGRVSLMTGAGRTGSPLRPALYRKACGLSGGAVACEYGRGIVAVGHVATERWTLYLKTPEPVVSLAFSPDGRTLAVGGERLVTLWDVPPPSGEAPAASPGVLAQAVRTLLGLGDPQPQPNAEPRAVLRGHARPVTALAFSSDGQTLLSGSDDQTVRCWDVASGHQQAAFDWEVGKVSCVSFAPDGLTAVAAGESGDVVIWDVM
jgi:WD40 repeat protein